MVAAASLVVGSLVMTSVSLGTSLPDILQGEWATAYTNDVVRPLLAVLANVSFNNIIFLVLWAVAGLAVYFVVEYCINLVGNLQVARRAVQFTANGVVPHSTVRAFLIATGWRIGVLAVGIPVLILGTQYVLGRLNSLAPQAVIGSLSGRSLLFQLSLLVLECTGLFHVVVVCVRLFAMRVRLFHGEIV